MTGSGQHQRARNDDGLATLELGLMLPWLLVFLFGAITLGQGYRVRHALRGRAVELARECALLRTATKEDCEELAKRALRQSTAPDWTRACQGPAESWRLRVEADTTPATKAGGQPLTMLMPQGLDVVQTVSSLFGEMDPMGAVFGAHDVGPLPSQSADPVLDAPELGADTPPKRIGYEGSMSIQVTVRLTCAYAGPLALGRLLTQADLSESLFSKDIKARATMSFVRTTF